jgi:hypothetical protein
MQKILAIISKMKLTKSSPGEQVEDQVYKAKERGGLKKRQTKPVEIKEPTQPTINPLPSRKLLPRGGNRVTGSEV